MIQILSLKINQLLQNNNELEKKNEELKSEVEKLKKNQKSNLKSFDKRK